MADEQTGLIYQAELDNKAVLASIDEMRKKAGEFEKQGDQAMAEYGKRVDDTAKQLKQLAKNLELGGTRGDEAKQKLSDFFGTSITGAKQFRAQLARMLKDIQAVGDTKEGAGVLDFDKLFGGDIKGKAARKILIKVIGTEEAEQKIEQLRAVTDKMMSGTDKSAKLIGTHLRALGEDLYTSFKKGGKGIDETNKELNEFLASAKKAQAAIKDFGETDLEKELKVHKAKAAMKDLDGTISKMAQSTRVEVRSAGVTFGKLRDQIKDAAKDPKADMNALIKKTKELNREAKSLGNAYENKVGGGARKASVSVYKLGTTMDRVGFRGAGGILRIADAFKGIPKSTVFAIAGIAGVGLAVVGLIKLVVRLEKAMIKAFVNITKEAVNVAKTFELTEKQLENVFKGKADVARHTLEKILDLSVEYGVDLTGEVAKIFLPLVDSFAQFEEIAEAVSTLAIGSGKTISESSRALKQMQAGRSRALLDMGLLASDVEKIKRLQESMGETAGLIAGMQAFFDRSGQEWDTYENTLQRVLGSLDMLKDKLLLTFGEPIKNQIVEELQGVIDWVEKNEEMIRKFLTALADTVTDTIGRIGEVVENVLNDINTDDLEEVAASFTDVANATIELIESVTDTDGTEFNPLIDGAIALLRVLEWSADTLKGIIVTLQDIGSLPINIVTAVFPTNLPTVDENFIAQLREQLEESGASNEQIGRMLLEEGRSRLAAIEIFMRAMNIQFGEAAKIIDAAAELDWQQLRQDMMAIGVDAPLFSRIEPVFGKADELTEEEKARRANIKAIEEERDAILSSNAAYQDFLITQEEYLAQVDEVREAEKALTEDMQDRFSEIFAATMATDIDDRIAEVGERIRIEQEKIANLETLEWKIVNIDVMDLDTVAEFGKMQIAGLQKDIDDTLEYITSQRGKMSEEELRRLQMEIDFKRKLIQLEQDHIDKIADLQTKRQEDEIDAQTDYDRREDSIRVKAARREIEMELDHSRAIERMEQAHQNRLREIRMRADFDAQEAIRMNDAVALLRIRRRMDFDIKMAEDKNKEQKQNAGVDAQDRRAKLARQLQYELDDLDTAHDQKLEDIATNFKRQLTLIEENYQKQLRAQAEQEKQKREDMLIWLKTELDDFNASWDEKNAALKVKWQDFYDIEKKYIGMVIEQRKRILSFNPQIGPWAGGFGAQYDPNSGIGSWFGNGGGGGGGGQGPPDYPNNDADGVSETLRRAVTNLLNRLVTQGANLDPDARTWGFRIINAISNNELRTIENQLRAQGVGGPGMQHGGQANVGQRYTVGEMGPEPFHPTKAGIIQPTQREYMPIGSPPIQNISTDNSRRIDAPISMLDPTYMSPVQITMIRGIVTEEILKSAI